MSGLIIRYSFHNDDRYNTTFVLAHISGGYLLPTGSEEREVGSIPGAILPSSQNMKIIAL